MIKGIYLELKKMSLEFTANLSEDYSYKKPTEKTELIFEISEVNDKQKIIETSINEDFSFSIGYTNSQDFKIKSSKSNNRDSFCLFKFDKQNNCLKIKSENGFPIMKLKKTENYEIQEKIKNDIIFDYKLLKNQALNLIILDKNNNFLVNIYDKKNKSLCRFCSKCLPDLLKQDKSEKFRYELNNIILSIPARKDFKIALSKTDDEKNIKYKKNFNKNFVLFSDELNPSSKKNHWFLCNSCYLAEFSSNNTSNKSNSELYNNSERENNNIEILENKNLDGKTLFGNTLIKVDEEYYTSIPLKLYIGTLIEKFNFIKDFFSKVSAYKIDKETFFQEIVIMQSLMSDFRNKLNKDKFTHLIFSAFSVFFEKYFNFLIKDLESEIYKKQSKYKLFFKTQDEVIISDEEKAMIINYLLIDIFSKNEKINEVDKNKFMDNDSNIKRLQKMMKMFNFLNNKICINEFNVSNYTLNKNKESSSISSKDLNCLTTAGRQVIKQSIINESFHNSKIKHKKENKINRRNEEKREFFSYTSRIIDMSDGIDYLYKTLETIKEKNYSILNNSILLNNMNKYFNRTLCEYFNENQAFNISEVFHHKNYSNLIKTQEKLNDELKNEEIKVNENFNKIKAKEKNYLIQSEKCQNFVESSFMKEYGFLSSKEISENRFIDKSIGKHNYKNKTKKYFKFRKTFQNEEDSICNIKKNNSAEFSSIYDHSQNLKLQKSYETQENKREIKFEKEENEIDIKYENIRHSNSSQNILNKEKEGNILGRNNKTNSSQIKKNNSIKKNSNEIINSQDYNNWQIKKPLLQMKDSTINLISSQESDNIQIHNIENKIKEEIVLVNNSIDAIDSVKNNIENEEEFIDINKIYVEDNINKNLGIKGCEHNNNQINSHSPWNENCLKSEVENKELNMFNYKNIDYHKTSKSQKFNKKRDNSNSKSRTRSRNSKSLENRRNSDLKINNSKDYSEIGNNIINLSQFRLKFNNSKKEFKTKNCKASENKDESFVALRKKFLARKKLTNNSKYKNDTSPNLTSDNESRLAKKIETNNKTELYKNEIIDLCDDSQSDFKNSPKCSQKQEIKYIKYGKNSHSKQSDKEIFIRKIDNESIFSNNLTNISVKTYNQSSNFFSTNNNENINNNYFKTNNINKNNNFEYTDFNNNNMYNDHEGKAIIDTNNILINKSNPITIPNLNSNLVIQNFYSNYNHIGNSEENLNEENNSQDLSKAETDDVFEELFANSKKKKKLNKQFNEDNLSENFKSNNEAFLVICSVPNTFVEKIEDEYFERLNLVNSFAQKLKEVFCKCFKLQIINDGISSDAYKLKVYFKNNYLKILNLERLKEGLDFKYEKYILRIEFINNKCTFTRCKLFGV